MPALFVRTCQGCGYELKSSSETKDKTRSSYIYRKCPSCKSEDFDWGSWRGIRQEVLQGYRDKFQAITGHEFVMTDNELEEILETELGENGLFEGNDLFNEIIKRSKANAESIAQATID